MPKATTTTPFLLTRKRFHPNQIRRILLRKEEQQQKKQLQDHTPKYWTGIHRGNYYRIYIPSSTKKKAGDFSLIPKLHTPTSAPLPLKNVSTTTSSRCHHHRHHGEKASSSGDCSSRTTTTSTTTPWFYALRRWLRDNATVLVLNFGSICTLIGFTRSDVLELRYLSVTGSICGVLFHTFTPPRRYTPIAWSILFAMVNSYKIYEIIQERGGSVNLSSEQEQRYSDFFMSHGVTPKQFETIDSCSKIIQVKKNQVIVRQGEVLQHVYLVVKGQTRATVLGRFLTAASFRGPVVDVPEEVDQSTSSSSSSPQRSIAARTIGPHRTTTTKSRGGGAVAAAGAWIGEMALLEHVWNEEIVKQHRTTNGGSSKVDHAANDNVTTTGIDQPAAPRAPAAAVENSKTGDGPIKTNHETNNSHINKEPLASIPQQQRETTASTVATTTNNTDDDNVVGVVNPGNHNIKENQNRRAMYTIVAQDDCTVLVWSHEKMKMLMAKSPDMKAALTRAMTAAIVGKVVTFTISRSSSPQQQQQSGSDGGRIQQQPTWLLSSWLSESSTSSRPEQQESDSLATTMQEEEDAAKLAVAAGKAVQTDSLEEDEDDEDAIDPSEQETLPRYPVRKFK